MKIKDKIIFWVVFVLVFVSCVPSVFGFLVFVGLIAIFHQGIIDFYRGNWYLIK